MSEEFVMVECSWDSGPFPTWGETKGKPSIDGPNGYGRNTVPIPRDVWERYGSAQEALHAAEDALAEVEDAFVKEARKTDPRWNPKP